MGSKSSEEEHQKAMRRMKVDEDWVLDMVLQVGRRNTFVMMLSEDVMPRYRYDPPPLAMPNPILLLPGMVALVHPRCTRDCDPR